MIDPAAMAARHPRPPHRSTTSWALGLLPPLYFAELGAHISTAGLSQVVSLDPTVLVRLQRCGIGARVEDYGRDLRRFELQLANRDGQGLARYPLVSVPTSAAIDWRTGALHIRSRTFIVAYDRGLPVFISREPHRRALVKVTLKQMRLLHRTWERWPAIMPSMLFTVLWHWPLSE